MAFYWSDDHYENVYMEITGRENLGVNLLAPLTASKGAETASYLLVPEVRMGDLVIHYLSSAKAIQAVSVATGDPEDDQIYWGSHGGTTTSARGDPFWRSGVRVPLGKTVWLDNPIDLGAIRHQEASILAVRDELRRVHGSGVPLYFPWVTYEGQPIRTFQSYLAKFPRGLLNLFPDLAAAVASLEKGEIWTVATSDEVEALEDAVATAAGRGNRPRGQGFMLDQQAKVAVEVHAMDEATAFYEADGWNVGDVHGNRPYDLVCTKDGVELRVEVKGTTTDGAKVILTANEVKHARTFQQVVLFVVSAVSITRDEDGVTASGGDISVYRPWIIDAGTLSPIGYRYEVPPASTGA